MNSKAELLEDVTAASAAECAARSRMPRPRTTEIALAEAARKRKVAKARREGASTSEILDALEAGRERYLEAVEWSTWSDECQKA